eukprot:6475264-Amphidinium_carterae.1
MVRSCLAFILDEIEQGRHMVACEPEPCDEGELFRTDAKGETGRVTLGGWESRGTPKESRWFSLRVDADQAPWLFREGEGSRTIATGELLATLVACQLFVPVQSDGKQRASCRVTGKTDNRGNSFIVKKMMTTKVSFGACAYAALPIACAEAHGARPTMVQAGGEQLGRRPDQRKFFPVPPREPLVYRIQ